MNTKGEADPISGVRKGGQRYPTKAVKSIPISAKSSRPVGTIQFANTVQEKGMFRRMGMKKFSPRLTESLTRHSLSHTYFESDRGERNVFRSFGSVDIQKLVAAKSFPLLYG